MRVADIPDNLRRLRQDIAEAAAACGRSPEAVRLLAVSKTFPPSAVDAAAGQGQWLFGENRVQEAELKIPDVTATGLEWHLIGHLQSNKAKRAVELFDVIQTVDSEKLALRLSRLAEEVPKMLPVFIQVNIGGESQKNGVAPSKLPALVETIDSLRALRLVGLMAIPPYEEDSEASRPYFRELHRLLEETNRWRSSPLPELSMGMSHDYRVAIEEGATLVRVGTAVFGDRNL
jgi:PLP dependent protein